MCANEKLLHATGKVDMIRADLNRADQHFQQAAIIGAVQQAIAQMNQLAAERKQGLA